MAANVDRLAPCGICGDPPPPGTSRSDGSPPPSSAQRPSVAPWLYNAPCGSALIARCPDPLTTGDSTCHERRQVWQSARRYPDKTIANKYKDARWAPLKNPVT